MNFLVPTLTQQLGMPTPTVTGLRSPYGNNETPPLRIEWDVLYEALVSYFGGAAPVGTYSLDGNRYRGRYKVSGVLSRDGVVYSGKVLLLERRSLRVVAETRSNSAGEYLIENLMNTDYMLLARDGVTLNDRPDFNATVIDYVRPEAMA